MGAWLFLVHRIPPRPLYLRAKMRQRLAAAGAVAVKNAVYVLPRSDDTLEDFQWIAEEITAAGGDAHLIDGEFVDPGAAAGATAQFRQARDQEYRALAAEAAAATKAAAGPDALSTAHDRLTRKLHQIQRIDFFEAPARREAERAIEAVGARIARHRTQQRKSMAAHAALRGRTWVTRPGVKVDRMASAWFIRRFIDPKARFRFEDPKQPRKAKDLRFDMPGGNFTHEGGRCTIETLIHRTGLPDAAVRAIAEIVHDIDLKDDKYGRPETAGVAAMIDGITRRHASDEARIQEGLALFDGLHEALGRGKRKQK